MHDRNLLDSVPISIFGYFEMMVGADVELVVHHL